jgi:hypothetical protein
VPEDFRTLLALTLVFPLVAAVDRGRRFPPGGNRTSVRRRSRLDDAARVCRSFCDIACRARSRNYALDPNRLESGGFGGRLHRDYRPLLAVVATRLRRHPAVGPLARLGVALGGRAGSGTDRRRTDPCRRNRCIAGFTWRTRRLARSNHYDGADLVPAAHSSAGVVLRRWRAVRPRRDARFVVTYSDQIGMQVNRHYPVRLGALGVAC